MRTLLLSALIALALTAPVAAIDSSLTYQGTLEDAGAPASGTYDLEFKLQDTAGTQVGNTLAFDNVVVTAGVFTVALNFGNGAFTGPDRFLLIAVRAGSSVGTYTTLAPRTKVTAAPYAQLAQDANFAASVANDSIGSAQIANASILSADIADGTVASVDIADGSIGSADINSALVQTRVSGTCAANSSINAIASNGTVTCEPDDSGAGGGDITAVNTLAGGGLSGGVATGDANLSIAVSGVTSAMIANGTIGGTDVDPAQIQSRVSSSCAVGSSIRVISSNGFVSCEIDDSGITGAWALAGNSSVPAGSFLGIADAASTQPLVLRARNSAVATFTPQFDATEYGDSPHVAFGSVGNIASGIGATVGGGGATLAGGVTCGPLQFQQCLNKATGVYATVAGGLGNAADGESSIVSGGTHNRAPSSTSTVSGGRNNVASGDGSTIGGGAFNKASGPGATVGGGHQNCAGGVDSWAGGWGAKIRRNFLTLTDDSCTDVASSDDSNGDEGTFVWADSPPSAVVVPFTSTGPNQFLVRAYGGTAFNGTPANPNFEMTIFGGADAFSGFVEMLLTPKPSLNGNTGESIEFGVGQGTAGNTNDATLRITQRNNLGGYTERLTIASNGDVGVSANAFKPGGGAWSVSSDARLKQDVTPLSGSLDRLLALRGVNFLYRDDAPKALTATGPQIGFIAQEVEQVFPQWIGEMQGYKTIGIRGFEALTVEALRDLKAETDVGDEVLANQLAALKADSAKIDAAHHAENAELRAQVAALLQRLNQLEASQSLGNTR